jgi:excisionase family DNA binding protein
MTNKKATIKLKPTIRIGEAAKLLGVTTMTLRRWDKAGYLKAIRLGNRNDRRYQKEIILKVLNEGLK